MLFGGVLADRLPRSHVLVAASLVQGVAQMATAAAILGGTGSVAVVLALQVVYGVGAGVVIPAEVGRRAEVQYCEDERDRRDPVAQGRDRRCGEEKPEVALPERAERVGERHHLATSLGG